MGATAAGNSVIIPTSDGKTFNITAVPGATVQYTISGPA
jgi:hypothetical protein